MMRRTASGLIVLMAALFLWSGRYLDVHPAWGYLHAFAEAAMVGGLADWFAVTALFRRPLGLPAPCFTIQKILYKTKPCFQARAAIPTD